MPTASRSGSVPRADARAARNAAALAAAFDDAPVLLWSATAAEQFDAFSSGWCRFTGRSAVQEHGHGWTEGIHPDDRERCAGILAASFGAQQAFELDHRLRRADGAWRWVVNRGEPRFDEDGGYVGHVGTVTDIHERKELEERLAERTRSLRVAERRRDEFLAMLSHELRNPLAPIANAAGVLRVVGADDARLVRLADIVERQVEHLRRIVSDLVDATRLTQGKIVLQRQAIGLQALVDTALEAVQSLLEARGHTVELKLPQPAPVLVGDPVRLTQALAALLSNAAKFTPEPSAIVLSAETGPRGLRLAVKDTGQGIAPEFLPYVFDLFAQQDQSLARSLGGLGVGLTIAKRVANLHGGTLEARSGGIGRGAEFVLTLPLEAAGAKVGAVRSARSAHQSHATGPAGPAAPSHYRVLVIEDNADARETLRMQMELWGNEVMTAGDAAEGLKLAGRFVPQIVLCDIGLPGMDGFRLIRPLREMLAGHATLFAALTGYGRQEDEARALAAGFDSFLVKPLRPESLGQLLRSYDHLVPPAQTH